VGICRPSPRLCFYARVSDPAILRRVRFYANDIDALERLGYEVTVARRAWEIPWNVDGYVIWWWTWAFLPLVVAKIRRRPAIVTGVFDYRFGPGDYFHRPWYQRLLMCWALRVANVNVLISELEAGELRRDFSLTNVRYSPCVVDTVRYSPGTGPRDRASVLTIAWLGGGNAQRKCIHEIVEAIPAVARSVPDVVFRFAGAPGEASEPLRRRVVELGVEANVEWLGTISEEEKINLLRTCTVYLQPSRFEGFGLGILEAMSCEAPIVTSSVGAVPEVVADVASFCDGTDPGSIAAEVMRLLQGNVADDRLRRGRARAEERFSMHRRVSDLADVLGVAGFPVPKEGQVSELGRRRS
jgi:glycosyltransferase involved in cell wall biosynthesis